jgi:hypothetical protein
MIYHQEVHSSHLQLLAYHGRLYIFSWKIRWGW